MTMPNQTLPSASPSVGAVIIAKNEEHCIERCLRSIRWTDEIVLIDDCSRDRTAEIARQAGCRIYTQPLRDFADQRNFGLQQATADWILHIDADEECTDALHREIRDKVNDPRWAGFRIGLRNRFLGRIMRGRDWAGMKSVRLARRDLSEWHRPVHESLSVRGPIGEIQAMIEHHGEPDYAARIQKSNRYTSLEAEAMAAKGVRFSLWRLLLLPPVRAARSLVLRGGWRDGLVGLIYAGHVWWGHFAIQVKLWELDCRNARSGERARVDLPER